MVGFRIKTPVVGMPVWVVMTVAAAFCKGESNESSQVEYNRDVRPILAEHCFRCHGADAKARKADLRLDQREDAIAKKAIAPHDPAHSGLLDRITTTDPEEVMPPKEEPVKLTGKEIALLKKWVTEGAAYQKHWAFIPPVQGPIPTEGDGGEGSMNPVDAFVVSALKGKGLKPAPPAAPEQWLRRVTFALTGLPPSLEAVDSFIADPSPKGKERVVEQLLASPAYGEHFAQDWLDVARYADSYGRHEDGDMVAWPWREWVINAFNKNLPYDQFVKWQTAGDLLPDPTREQLVATAFNRLSPQSNESGNDPVEFRLDQVSDRVRVNGLAFMGLSVECAKCHDHKYDPITQKEYWQMAAMFDNIDENGVYSQFCPKAVPSPSLVLPTDSQRIRTEALKWQVMAIEKELTVIKEQVRPEYDAWIAANGIPGEPKPGFWNKVKGWFGDGEPNPWNKQAKGWLDFEEMPKKSKELRNRANSKRPAHLRTKMEMVESPAGKGVLFKGDDEIEMPLLGVYHRYEPFSFALWLQPKEHRDRAVVVSWSRGGIDDGRGYEVLLQNEVPEFALMHFHPGNECRIRAKKALPLNQWTHLAVSYDGSSRAEGLRIYLNGEAVEVEVVEDHLHKDIVRREEWGDIDRDQIQFALGGRYHDNPLKNCAVDEFYVFGRALSSGEAKHLARVSARADDWYEWWLQTKCGRWKDMAHHAMLLRKKLTDVVDDTLEMMVMEEKKERRPAFVRLRGDYRQPADEILPGTPAEVMPFPDSLPKNRLGFAQWLTSKQHPLTARVEVNRLWQQVFGAGLVRTPQDFGTRGEMPTHPELLDWLACDFMNHGWDVKRLLRLLVLSDTFAQDATPADPALLETDPENRLLARGPRTRLTAEEVRDQALMVSGLLCTQIGGPSVHTYMPREAYRDAALQQPFMLGTGNELHRRSLYSFWRRTLPPPELAAFDAPSREFCVVKREKTTSPSQALMLLNQTQFVEAQRVLAEKLVRELPEDGVARCNKAFRLLISRAPTEKEMEVLTHLVDRQREFFTQHAADAKTLLTANGDVPADPKLPPVEVAATTMMVRALMSHDEALNR